MKNVKTLLVLFIFPIALSCTKTNSDKPGDDVPSVKKTTATSKPYQSFPVMADLAVIGNNREVFQEYITKNKISEAAADPSVSWEEMNDLFEKINDKPSYGIQYIGYIILAKKDLIAENGSAALKAKKHYIEELINTNYRGYGVLYYSLGSLAKSDQYKSFVADASAKIIKYAAEDKEAKSLLKRDLSTLPENVRIIQQKLKSNFEYIEKIRTDFANNI